MMNKVVIFELYPFEVGQRIRIESGPRKGDWEVVGVNNKKVKLRCPVTSLEVEWAKFCYFVEERENEQWPLKDYC